MNRLKRGISFVVAIAAIGATTVIASNGIKSVSISDAKIAIDGELLPLSNNLISVTKEDEKDARLYMPTREILENLGYEVSWNGEENIVNIKSKSPTDVSTVENTENQVITISIANLKPNDYKEIGEYFLNSNATIRFSVGATGKGLAVGFVKSKDNPATADSNYFTQSISGKNAIITNDAIVPPSLAGSYKLYVKNIGEEILTDITGKVELINNSAIQEAESINTPKSISNVEFRTVQIDIASLDNALKGGENTPLHSFNYFAFGPYSSKLRDLEVMVDIVNEANGSMFIGTSPNKEVTKGVTNTFTTQPFYKGSIGIFADEDGKYFVIIGAKDIKNLNGTIKIPVSN